MKETINQIIELINKLFKQIIDKLFKKVEKKIDDLIPEDLGANWYGPNEADQRDFKVENVLGIPTEEELKKLPQSINLLQKADPLHYVNQGSIPCCTCASLSNGMIVTECIERKDRDVSVDCCWLRTGLGHKCQSNERGDYLENALKTLKKIGLKSNKGVLKIDGYAYAQANKEIMKYWLSKGFPLYYAFRGNRQTWYEMSKGEILTTKFTPTGGHAVIAIGYDDKYLYFMNSWRVNDGSQYKGDYSVFKITWDRLNEMLKYGLANWRFWIFYNHKDNDMLFEDYKGEPGTEQYEAVKFMKDNGIVTGENGKLFPGRPATRLEVIVMLYRLYKKILKLTGK